VLAVAVVAVLTGASSLAAIGEWASDAPGQVLAALGVRRDPTGAFRPPGEATVTRVLARIDADALDRAVDSKTLRLRHEVARGEWLRWRRFDVMSRT